MATRRHGSPAWRSAATLVGTDAPRVRRRPAPPRRVDRGQISRSVGAHLGVLIRHRPTAPELRLGRRLVVAAAALLVLGATALLGLRSAYSNEVYPAVHVADVDLGGLTREESRAALQARVEPLDATAVRFTAGERTWTPTLRELGVRFDLDTSLERAYLVGREASARDRLRSSWALARRDERFPLGATLDHALLDRWFAAVDQELGPPVDAKLAVDGTDVTVVPDVTGTVVDRPRATALILSAVRGLRPVDEPLPTLAKVPAVRAGDLAAHRDRLAVALARPLTVRFGNASWPIAPGELGRFVVQRVDPAQRGAAAVTVALDEAALQDWLAERFVPEVDREPVDAVVGWNERPVLVDESVDGIHLKPQAFTTAVVASFFGDGAPIPIPVDTIEPRVRSDEVDDLGITTRLARGDSYYGANGDNRSLNVEIGTALLNNTLVPPGGEFSFNAAIGEITADKGYVESVVVEAERAGKDIGGGICQVSTTVFRAALMGGLPITEWWPHAYRILGYEIDGWGPGYDASILQAGSDPAQWGDFRFENPTDSWLLVESWTADGYVIVNIYGPDLGYDVQFTDTFVSDPITTDKDLEVVNPELEPGTVELTESPVNGYEVHFTRDVYDRDGELVGSRQFYTRYRERANVYQVSPDMEGESPASTG